MVFGIISYTSAFFQWDERYYMLGDELLGLVSLMSDYNPIPISPTREILKSSSGHIISFDQANKELKFNRIVRKYYETLCDCYDGVTVGRNSFGIIMIGTFNCKKLEKVRKVDEELAKFLKRLNLLPWKWKPGIRSAYRSFDFWVIFIYSLATLSS